MWVWRVDGDNQGGVGTTGACGNEAVDAQHGIAVRETHILVERATTPNKGFFLFKCHTYVDCLLCML